MRFGGHTDGWPRIVARRILRRRPLILFAAGIVAALPIWILVLQNPQRAVPAGDPPGYVSLAQNLIVVGRFSPSGSEPYQPEIFRTPGYPAFLSLIFLITGFSIPAAVVVQGLLHAISGSLVGELGERFFGSPRVGWAAGILWVAAPIPLLFSGMLFTETLFTFLFLAALALLTHPSVRAAAWAGAILGLAILVRPIGMMVGPALLPAAAWGLRRTTALARVAALLLAGVIVIAPWVVRNWLAFGQPTLTTIGGVNLLYYNAGSCLGWQNGEGWDSGREAALAEYRADLAASGRTGLSPVDAANAMSATAVKIILRQPLGCAVTNLFDSLNTFRPGVSYTLQFLDPASWSAANPGTDLSPATSRLSEPLVAVWTGLLSVFYGFLFLFSAIGLFVIPRGQRLAFLLFWILPCVVLVYAPGLAGNARFRVPVEPALCLLAGGGLIQVQDFLVAKVIRRA